MKFLIDECLATGLVQVAINGGHAAHHVAHVGLQGAKDWDLVEFAGPPGFYRPVVLDPAFW